jgi:(1->4)-alpha-D-glucan 1-alpha-D-glucosylmutase
VDYAARAGALADVGVPDLRAEDAGSAKLAVTHRLLKLRAEMPALFAQGNYSALDLGAEWLGFTRQAGAESLLVVVPRAWRAGAAPSLPATPAAGAWRDALTDAAWQGVSSLDPAFPFIVATHS